MRLFRLSNGICPNGIFAITLWIAWSSVPRCGAIRDSATSSRATQGTPPSWRPDSGLADALTCLRGGGDDPVPLDAAPPSPPRVGVPDGEGPYHILDETVAYSGWRTIHRRRVRMRNGRVVDFDLVGVKTGSGAVMVFAWDTRTKTATVIREYMPASNRVLWGLAAGLVEAKHDQFDPEVAARHELEEECHLKNGRWISLCHEPSAMDKYSTTVVHCYLVLDPEPEDNPRPLDDEEDIEIVSGVTIPEILQWIQNGEMNLVGGWGCLLAIQKLRELGEYE